MKQINTSSYFRLAGTAVIAALLSAPSAQAERLGPTAVYNEAVKVIDGVRHVQLPPLSNDDRVTFVSTLPPDKKPAESPQQAWLQGIKWDTPERERYVGWIMVEASDGLVECIDALYHPNRCRPSTYGKKTLGRVWMVLRQSTWMLCADPKKVDRLNRCERVLQPREGDISFRPSTSGPFRDQ